MVSKSAYFEPTINFFETRAFSRHFTIFSEKQRREILYIGHSGISVTEVTSPRCLYC